MKKVICLTSLMVLLVLSACSFPSSRIHSSTDNQKVTLDTLQEEVDDQNVVLDRVADFQNSNWGMTKSEVLQAEAKGLSEMDIGNLAGVKDVSGREAIVSFEFENGKLYDGMIIFTDEHTNENLYIDDYNSIKNALCEKYGEPVTDWQDWSDDLYRDDPDEWGFAVSLGDVAFYTTWKTETTEIAQILTGDNFEVTHFINYRDVNYEQSADTTGL